MDDQRAAGWLHRRAGFGLHPTELDDARSRGATAELARLTAPAATRTAPWDGLELDPQDNGRVTAVLAWLEAMHTSAQPFHDRRTFMLHGWLVSAMDKVSNPVVMTEQIQLFSDTGGGSFPDLLRAVTTDRAMLVYLDGRTSTAAAPNENYGRELLELFALGVGHYTEADVQAAARSLTGWVVVPRFDTARFVPNRHDNTPQTLLGLADVSDVDGVIEAVVAHERHATFVAARIMHEYLGDLPAAAAAPVIDELAATYLDNGRRLDAVIVRALELGLDDLDGASPMVLAPIPWLLMCARATGTDPIAARRGSGNPIRDMGQVPLLPPSVAGWPTGPEWLTSSSVVARTRVASALAQATDPAEPLAVAVVDGDLDLAARHLGLADGFSASTTSAIQSASDPAGRLALVLASPENLLA